jgi:integrase
MLISDIDRWLALRRTGGYILRNYELHLHRFAEFAATRKDTFIRRETAVAWASRIRGVVPRSRFYQRLVQLSRFLHAEDPRHELLPDRYFPEPRRRPVPYIYSPAEARRLIEAAYSIRESGSILPDTVATMIGLLFATGLRISEAVALSRGDVTSDGLIVRRAKRGKTRLVPLHPSAASALAKYMERHPGLGTDHVFVSRQGGPFSQPAFRRAWSVVRERAALATYSKRSARIHDIRHTFAVRALESAPRDRGRIGEHMLAVSTYLGHSYIADTYWYFQHTPKLMAQISAACRREFERGTP